jgi:predicted amidohydrolase YtcJ
VTRGRGATARAALALGALASACGGQPSDPADVVLRGGIVYTVDRTHPSAEAVAVRDGRIVYVGNSAGASGYVGRDTEVVELNGRMVLPGFHDTHVHPISGGVELGECDLNPGWPCSQFTMARSDAFMM